jgi:hypothetical protein
LPFELTETATVKAWANIFAGVMSTMKRFKADLTAADIEFIYAKGYFELSDNQQDGQQKVGLVKTSQKLLAGARYRVRTLNSTLEPQPLASPHKTFPTRFWRV